MSEKYLGPSLDQREKNMVAQYLCAVAVRNRLVWADLWLGHLEDKASDQANKILIKPVVENAIVIYCSGFNESGSYSRFNYKKVFGGEKQRELHKLLVDYRNTEIAHMDDKFTSEWLRTEKSHKKPLISGYGSYLVNELVPGTETWTRLREQLSDASAWLKEKETDLKKQISDFLESQDDSWFEELPDAPLHQPPF